MNPEIGLAIKPLTSANHRIPWIAIDFVTVRKSALVQRPRTLKARPLPAWLLHAPLIRKISGALLLGNDHLPALSLRMAPHMKAN